MKNRYNKDYNLIKLIIISISIFYLILSLMSILKLSVYSWFIGMLIVDTWEFIYNILKSYISVVVIVFLALKIFYLYIKKNILTAVMFIFIVINIFISMYFGEKISNLKTTGLNLVNCIESYKISDNKYTNELNDLLKYNLLTFDNNHINQNYSYVVDKNSVFPSYDLYIKPSFLEVMYKYDSKWKQFVLH